MICLLPYEPEGPGGFSHHAGAERAALLPRNGFTLPAAGRLVRKQQTNGANGSFLLFFPLFFFGFVCTFTPCWVSEVNNLLLLRHMS